MCTILPHNGNIIILSSLLSYLWFQFEHRYFSMNEIWAFYNHNLGFSQLCSGMPFHHNVEEVVQFQIWDYKVDFGNSALNAKFVHIFLPFTKLLQLYFNHHKIDTISEIIKYGTILRSSLSDSMVGG